MMKEGRNGIYSLRLVWDYRIRIWKCQPLVDNRLERITKVIRMNFVRSMNHKQHRNLVERHADHKNVGVQVLIS